MARNFDVSIIGFLIIIIIFLTIITKIVVVVIIIIIMVIIVVAVVIIIMAQSGFLIVENEMSSPFSGLVLLFWLSGRRCHADS